jgi:hypothetical protein
MPSDIQPEGDDYNFDILTNPTRLISNKSSQSDIDKIRARVFDGDINTAWFCEYVQDTNNPDRTPLEVL